MRASIQREVATDYTFVYGTDPTLTSGTTTTAALSAGSGTSDQPESAAVTGLTPNTTYYFEVQATSAGGTTDGTILYFNTSPPPYVNTLDATSITATGATLNARVNPEGSATSYTFIYGTVPTLAFGTTSTTAKSAGSGSSVLPETTAVAGLTPNTIYYFKVQATSAGGTIDGTILNFTTSPPPASTPPPSATTVAATSISSNGATLNASVNPAGNVTTYSFIYGTDPTLASGTTTTAAQSAGNGTSAQPETIALSGLNVGTTYYYRVVATNSAGTSLGSITSFATPAVVQFSGGLFTANVNAGSGEIVLTRAGDLGATLTVTLSSPGGDHVAGFAKTVTFNPSVQSTIVPVTIVNDGQPGENNAVIALALSSPSPGATWRDRNGRPGHRR